MNKGEDVSSEVRSTDEKLSELMVFIKEKRESLLVISDHDRKSVNSVLEFENYVTILMAKGSSWQGDIRALKKSRIA
jgi:hypothetical protein